MFQVGFQPTQHLRQCSGYGSYSIRVLLFQVLPTLSLKVSVIPGIRCTKLEENWLSPVQAFVPPSTFYGKLGKEQGHANEEKFQFFS